MNLFSEDNHEHSHYYKLFSSLIIHEPADIALLEAVRQFRLEVHDTGTEVRLDYIQLFSDAAGELPPYESLYHYELWEIPKVWGRVTEDIAQFYYSTGITINEDLGIVPDHLGIELLFMSYLIEYGMIERQKTFLEKHLCIWVPGYCDDIASFSQTSFYQQISLLLKDFIHGECETFGVGDHT